MDALNQWQTWYFHLRLIFGRHPFKVIKTVAIIKGNFSCLADLFKFTCFAIEPKHNRAGLSNYLIPRWFKIDHAQYTNHGPQLP